MLNSSSIVYVLMYWALCHENIWGMEVSIYAFPTTTLDGGEWSISCPSDFPFEQRKGPTGTHRMEGVMGARNGLDMVTNRHISTSVSGVTLVI